MRLCKSSNIRWALLWGKSLGEILVFHSGLYNSWSAGLGAVILGESFSICLLTIQSLTSLGNRVAYMPHWECQGTLGQDRSLSIRCINNLQVRSCMFETSLYKARNRVLRQYINTVLLLAAFLAEWEDSRVTVRNVTHSFVIRISVAFPAQLTSRPLNGDHLRMDHVWGKTWKWQPFQRRQKWEAPIGN